MYLWYVWFLFRFLVITLSGVWVVYSVVLVYWFDAGLLLWFVMVFSGGLVLGCCVVLLLAVLGLGLMFLVWCFVLIVLF